MKAKLKRIADMEEKLMEELKSKNNSLMIEKAKKKSKSKKSKKDQEKSSS
jgi:hypothetical protein